MKHTWARGRAWGLNRSPLPIVRLVSIDYALIICYKPLASVTCRYAHVCKAVALADSDCQEVCQFTGGEEEFRCWWERLGIANAKGIRRCGRAGCSVYSSACQIIGGWMPCCPLFDPTHKQPATTLEVILAIISRFTFKKLIRDCSALLSVLSPNLCCRYCTFESKRLHHHIADTDCFRLHWPLDTYIKYESSQELTQCVESTAHMLVLASALQGRCTIRRLLEWEPGFIHVDCRITDVGVETEASLG